MNTVELIVIHNCPCELSSKLQLSIRFTPSRCLDVRQDWYPMYYPEGMKAWVSPVQSIEPHRILAPTRDSNQEPPGLESRVVTTILPLHTISESSVVFVISFLFLQLQRLPIHSSPANLIIVIHSTMAFRKLTWTKYSAYKILFLVSLQIHQNLNTLHQYSKNYIGFQSNNASITNCVFLHIKRFKFSNLPIFTIVFLFLLTLCLQDHLIHRFCPSHMSRTSLGKRAFFVIALQDSGTPSHLTPVTRYLFLHSAQNSKPIFSS